MFADLLYFFQLNIPATEINETVETQTETTTMSGQKTTEHSRLRKYVSDPNCSDDLTSKLLQTIYFGGKCVDT